MTYEALTIFIYVCFIAILNPPFVYEVITKIRFYCQSRPAKMPVPYDACITHAIERYA